MQIIYKNDAIVDVILGVDVLQDKLTHQEKMDFFACAQPNKTVCQNIQWLETGAVDEDEKPMTTLELTVQSMVTAGLISQQRANELLS